MEILQATETALQEITDLVQTTTRTIYPHYYPPGAVQFFCEYHCQETIAQAIACGQVYIGKMAGKILGTISCKQNEINRFFVWPELQKQGVGSKLLGFMEGKLFAQFDTIQLDAAWPAYEWYLHRGYLPKQYGKIMAVHDDYLCYVTLQKKKNLEMTE